MTSPTPDAGSSSKLDQILTRDPALDMLCSAITHTDMLRILNSYNSTNRGAEKIWVLVTPESLGIAKKQSTKRAPKAQDSEALSALNEVIDKAPMSPAEALSKYPALNRTPPLPAGDIVPTWLGMAGYEYHTMDWFGRQGSGELVDSYPPIFNAQGEKLDEELVFLKCLAIALSRKLLLHSLRQCISDLQNGLRTMTKEVTSISEAIVRLAKGKDRTIDDDEPIEVLEHSISVLMRINDPREMLIRSWWCYNRQCQMTSSDMHQDVVEAARTILALTDKLSDTSSGNDENTTNDPDSRAVTSTEQKTPVSNAASGGDVKDSEEKKIETEAKQPLAGYEALTEVLLEEDKRYPKHAMEILREASERSGVDIETILVQASKVWNEQTM